MIILFSIIIYAIGCLIESEEKCRRRSEQEKERKHRELIKAMNKQKKQIIELMERKSNTPRVERHILRHVAKGTDGVMYAEERIEEIEQ